MSETGENVKKIVEPPCFGRQKYYTAYKPEDITKENVVEIVKKYFNDFIFEIDTLLFLDKYFRGQQPILQKTRDDEDAGNNKVVVNLARTATNKIKQAFVGEETQYLPIDITNTLQKKALKDLLVYYRSIEEPAHNARIEGDRGKYGYAYEFVGRKDGHIKIKRLKPFYTCAVFDEDDEDDMVFVFNFHKKYDMENKHSGYHFSVYTKTKIFEYDTNTSIGLDSSIIETPNTIGIIPIVRYENNDELMGDFEPAIPVLNGINEVYSKRLDNISDIVEALLVFVNSSIYEEKEDENGNITYDNKKIKAMQKNRVVELHGEQGLPADIKHIVNTLDQSNTQIVCDNLARLAYVIMGVPDGVNAKTSGGGDTGEAANTREGYKDFQQLLNDKERLFKKGLKERIEIIRRLSLFDNDNQLRFIQKEEIDIRFIRQKSLNDQSEAQALATLNETGLFSKDTILTQSNLCESPQEEIDKVINTYKKLLKDKVLTQEQYKKAVASYYLPKDVVSAMFTNTTDKENNEGEDDGKDDKQLQSQES